MQPNDLKSLLKSKKYSKAFKCKDDYENQFVILHNYPSHNNVIALIGNYKNSKAGYKDLALRIKANVEVTRDVELKEQGLAIIEWIKEFMQTDMKSVKKHDFYIYRELSESLFYYKDFEKRIKKKQVDILLIDKELWEQAVPTKNKLFKRIKTDRL